ncbi:helix-turn-helix domain-containing protein [Spirillospora sp. NPDC052269]
MVTDTVPGEPLEFPAAAAGVFGVLHRRWAPHLLMLLNQRPAGFVELQRAVPGLSSASLNERLRDLVEAGLVVRRHCPGPPMTSRYELTVAGAQVGRHLTLLASASAL